MLKKTACMIVLKNVQKSIKNFPLNLKCLEFDFKNLLTQVIPNLVFTNHKDLIYVNVKRNTTGMKRHIQINLVCLEYFSVFELPLSPD